MRSKKQVLLEEYGVSTVAAASEVLDQARLDLEETRPPLNQWIKMDFPYIAPNAPKLPSFDDLQKAMKTDKFKIHSMNNVCRIGEFVVKCNHSYSLLQVGENITLKSVTV